jgi:ribonucleases P/MRP protein subunit RPP40
MMHIGQKENRNDYVLKNSNGNTTLTKTTEERDLGILVRNDLKPSPHCAFAAAKASAVMGLVSRHFKNMDQEDFLIMYKTYIRPTMECCIQVRSPHLAKDIQLLERVQRKSTKLVRGFHKLSYKDCLRRLGLTTLEERRNRGDLIEVYKLLHRKENNGYEQFFKLAKVETSRHDLKGHSMKLFHNRTRLDTRKFYFSQRVVSPWNNLPQHVVDASPVNCFKNVYDRFMNQDMDN